MTTPTPPQPPYSGGQCDVTYRVRTQVTATWRRNAAPQEVLSVRTIVFENTVQGKVLSIAITNPDYRIVPDGFSYLGFETVVISTSSGAYTGGANNGGSNSTSNIISVYDPGNSIQGTFGIRCDAQTNSVSIVSVTRVDGQLDNCGNIPEDSNNHPGNSSRNSCSLAQPFKSEVEAHTGAVIETQNLVSYQSLGVSRSLVLRYDSLTADPRAIVHFRYSEVYNPNQLLIAKLSFQRGSFNYRVPGYQGTQYGLTGGENFWAVPIPGNAVPSGIIDGAMLADLRSQPSGRYTYTLERSVLYFDLNTPQFTPLSPPETGKLIHVNNIDSIFGSGWAISGWQEIIDNPDGSVLLLDGNGNQLIFEAASGNTYTSPAGDYSTLVKLADGTYRRTLKDRTVYKFNAQKKLSMVRDRQGNQTRYLYNATAQLTQIIDPVNLTTNFTYTNNRVTTITDPANRVTQLEYDGTGNLIRLTHPDNAQIAYEYDSSHRMTASTDARGNRGTAVYNFAGRAIRATRKDGSVVRIQPVATKGLYPANLTNDPLATLVAFNPSTTEAVAPAAIYTDGNNNATTYRLNQRGNIVSAVDAVGVLPSYQYDNLHQITQMTDSRGQITNYTYDATGNVTRLTDAISGTIGKQYTYDGTFNQISSITDELGRQTTYQIDAANGNILSVTQVVGGSNVVTSYTYDIRGLVITSTDPLGRTTVNDYDAQGRLIRVTLAQGSPEEAVSTYQYDAAGNVTQFTDAKGNATQYFYDSFNRLIRTVQPDPDGTGNLTAPVTIYSYDAAGNRISVTDARGNITQYAYDALNRQTQVTQPDPDGTGILTAPVTTNAYDAVGNLVSVTDPLNRLTQYRYDDRNRLIQTIEPLNRTTSYSYDLGDNQIAITDTLNRTTQFVYDARNRLVSQTDTLNQSTTNTYDATDNLLTVTDALNQITTYTYDALNRRLTETNPLSQTITTAYDLVDNVISITDALNRTTQYRYDSLNRTNQIIDALNRITAMTYDKVGNLTQITDPLNNATTYSYDTLDRLLTETNPLAKVRSYQYDPLGNPIQVQDRNNRVRTFTYDGLNRLVTEQWLSTTNTVIRTISYTYDTAGQLIVASDPDSSYRYTYDALGRQLTEDNIGTVGVPNVLLNATYNRVGNRLSLSETINAQLKGTATFNYDNIDRLAQITQTGTDVVNKRVNFIYNAIAQITKINRYASLDTSVPVTSTTHTYDAASRLTEIKQKQGTNTISNRTWIYDAAARITQNTSNDGTSAYSYDNTDQLTAVDHSYQTDEAYSYDANGNRTNTNYTNSTNNRLTGDGTFTYTYDNEGNRTKRTRTATGEVTNYTYDRRNRLTKVETKNGATVTKLVTYIYDVFDRRIGKTVDPDGSGSLPAIIERFVYDRDHILLSFDGSGNLTHRYLHGAMLDQILADESNGQVLWTLTDNLGTVRDLVNSAGVVQNQIKYDSFGNITSQTNASIKTRFGYTGREFDAETGLYYYRARYYDPLVGRFISEDPISFAGGDSNLYRYVGNNPVDKTDPMGQYAIAGAGLVVLLALVIIVSSNLVLQGRIRKRKKEKIERNPQPNPTPERIPVDPNCNEKKETCDDPPFNTYDRCSDLERKGYEKTLNDAISLINAYRERVFRVYDKLTPQREIEPFLEYSKFDCKSPIGGRHYNIYISGTFTSAGSVGSCKCCIEKGGKPDIENFRFKPLNAKDRTGTKYEL